MWKVDETMLQRAKLGVGVIATGLALVLAVAVLPAATASASIERSSICKAYKAEETKSINAGAALGKDIESGNYAAIKKALLATFNGEANSEKQFLAVLNGASAKVKAAAAVSLKLVNQFKSIIEKSTTVAQFEAGITAAESSPKIKAALTVLDAYTTKLCGAVTPVT
jgi:hypothetical protein